MNPKEQYVNEPWQVGISASGITGPTVDSTRGATVSEQCDYNRFAKEVNLWVANGSKGPMPSKKVQHPSILITQGMRVVAIVPTGAGDGEKNARLIAKAPLLLLRLKTLLLCCEQGNGLEAWAKIKEQSRQVIAEVEGEE